MEALKNLTGINDIICQSMGLSDFLPIFVRIKVLSLFVFFPITKLGVLKELLCFFKRLDSYDRWYIFVPKHKANKIG
jgi:hypothetical protein